MNNHSEDCDVNDINPDGIKKPCNCRITEAALLIANVAKDTSVVETEIAPSVMWIHHPKWTMAINRTKNPISVMYVSVGAKIPFGGFAVFSEPEVKLSGVFDANEGYLNNADEFIADMRQLLEKEAV